ncbi:ATPase associated with various cellular activities AAA_5 [Brachyspira intermedia PWS/A]|uniref:ATPase associated with various cellular activities AAA_5 n=1 Tax=Brachyspira intermedia (strain ATCC 51140 / PWS/A) TaxID=1045858 RepID=G0ELD4_BRAIP|nr:AAA family ATPase [Brachyspira intermedia]AEM21512.1 ATPase associated with various cellular activities AAA_5 [Brachyspira intermedia PWS/A]
MELSKEKINYIIEKLSEGLYEKEDVISFTFLCALARKSVFLYGPPGTAKSLIVRRIASAFKDSKYFGQLMNRFTTPEDVFGPVSLSKLKEDKFERQTEGYLPKADFVFLDEIWKSSPAILNTLLTIINEKVYRNGSIEEKVPLKILVAASNETPPKGQGLDAMYDRFIMRLLVNPAQDIDNFKSLIVDKDIDFNADLNEEDKISAEDLESLKSNIEEVEVPSNILNIIISIKNEIDEYNKGNNESIYISDRRWKNIVYILKASAYFSDRKEILPSDCFLISHCIWTLEENINAVNNIVKKSIMRFFNNSNEEFDYDKIYDEAEELRTNIDKDSVSDRDEYENEINIKGKRYFPIDVFYEYKNTHGNNRVSIVKLYIEIDKINNNTQFNPLMNIYDNDAFNNANNRNPKYNDYYDNYSNLKNSTDYVVADNVFCSFTNSNTIHIKTNNYYNRFVNKNGDIASSLNMSIPIKFRKGDIKPIEYNKRDSYMHVCSDLLNTVNNKIESYESDLKSMIERCDSVFINKRYIQKFIYNNDYLSSLKSLKINIEHCIDKIKG